MSGYDRDQAQYRKETHLPSNDEEGEEDLDLDATHQEAPVNPEIYRDLEPILFRGFVSRSATINDIPFVFKSLNHHEFEHIQLAFGGEFGKGPPKTVARQFDLFLALGVLFIEGVNVLANRDAHLPDVSKMFREMPEPVREKLIFHLSEINRRANRAVLLVEAFSFEHASRFRWQQFRHETLNSMAVTGLAGTDRLGLNWGQLTWRALNELEDQRENHEREWENAKFIASAMAGKGMSKVHNQDKRRRKQERDDRATRKDKILRLAIFNESPEATANAGQQIVIARTVEELASQFEKDLRGEKDWHATVVDQYENQVRDRYAAQRRIMQERYAEHEREYGSQQVVGGRDPKQRPLRPHELQQHIKERQDRLAAAVSSMPQNPVADPRTHEFIERWAPTNPEATKEPVRK